MSILPLVQLGYLFFYNKGEFLVNWYSWNGSVLERLKLFLQLVMSASYFDVAPQISGHIVFKWISLFPHVYGKISALLLLWLVLAEKHWKIRNTTILTVICRRNVRYTLLLHMLFITRRTTNINIMHRALVVSVHFTPNLFT